jgi:hypothetical protein
LGIFVVLVVVIGVAVGVTLGNKADDGDLPTFAPTTFRESEGIQAQVERVVGSDFLEDPESPYARALDWIMYDEPFQLTLQDISTSKPSRWVVCLVLGIRIPCL